MLLMESGWHLLYLIISLNYSVELYNRNIPNTLRLLLSQNAQCQYLDHMPEKQFRGQDVSATLLPRQDVNMALRIIKFEVNKKQFTSLIDLE